MSRGPRLSVGRPPVSGAFKMRAADWPPGSHVRTCTRRIRATITWVRPKEAVCLETDSGELRIHPNVLLERDE